MKRDSGSHRVWPLVRNIGVAVGMLVGVVVLMMWLMGVWHPKLDESGKVADAGRPVGDAELVKVERIRVPVIESAVGTIHPVHPATMRSKLLATVVAVHVRAGQHVNVDDMLVELDDEDLKAQREQAAAAVDEARAAHERAKANHERVEALFKVDSAEQIEMINATAALRSTEAVSRRAEHVLAETQTRLQYAKIRSPMDGVVVDKQVEEGDTVVQGQTLVTLYDQMQLVARVRESLRNRLREDQEIGVRVEAIGLSCRGRISEIVPEAESVSRTFAVKVTGPCPEGVYPGMFGRLQIPLDDAQVLVIPRSAVRRVGQLDVVEVAKEGVLHRRAVVLGETGPAPDKVQVLSGLREGEEVAASGAGDRRGVGV